MSDSDSGPDSRTVLSIDGGVWLEGSHPPSIIEIFIYRTVEKHEEKHRKTCSADEDKIKRKRMKMGDVICSFRSSGFC